MWETASPYKYVILRDMHPLWGARGTPIRGRSGYDISTVRSYSKIFEDFYKPGLKITHFGEKMSGMCFSMIFTNFLRSTQGERNRILISQSWVACGPFVRLPSCTSKNFKILGSASSSFIIFLHRKPILYVCLIGFLWYHGVERNINKCMG